MHNLTFTHDYKYEESSLGIDLGITIHVDSNNRLDLNAKLDTGCHFCLFQKTYADLLGIDVESGLYREMFTLNGGFDTYGHEVCITFQDIEWQSTVYFPKYEIPRSLLGRIGFLDQLKIALVDYERLLYLSSAA